uniref:Uncharacterized protein n=1 Tax=Vespula pensylvanica TaxID=30213 RepID=A0A834UHZ6_VESPE|nr:hypothetical protein H0235_001909 [Vespula pensylvanica]
MSCFSVVRCLLVTNQIQTKNPLKCNDGTTSTSLQTSLDYFVMVTSATRQILRRVTTDSMRQSTPNSETCPLLVLLHIISNVALAGTKKSLVDLNENNRRYDKRRRVREG